MDVDRKTDGGVPAGVDYDELYAVVHSAVRDALLDVLGTLVLLVFALGLVAVGASALSSAPSSAGYGLGIGLIFGGFLLAAIALRSSR